MPTFLIYGANGYTGELIARRAAAQGLRPILAGRSKAVIALASDLELEHRLFALDDPAALDAGLRGISAVLHCAGPFSHTYRPMADACLRMKAHYLDITGEIAVFDGLAKRSDEARAAGVMLMPGVGFDVVPSDCLAVHLKRRLPSATHLALGFLGVGPISRGTATTMAENFHKGGVVRRNGVLTPVPAAWKTRTIDFGTGPLGAFTIPWGDVATAYYSTGIPNIEVYVAAPWLRRLAARMSRYLGWAFGPGPVQAFLKKRIRSGLPGPTADERERGSSFLWGEATDNGGESVVSRLRGPEGYTFTVLTALAVVDRVLTGEALPGFQTPAKVYGPDFILGVSGVVRKDE
jgi:short subunit dehydrogenase-like uncharacterized protein